MIQEKSIGWCLGWRLMSTKLLLPTMRCSMLPQTSAATTRYLRAFATRNRRRRSPRAAALTTVEPAKQTTQQAYPVVDIRAQTREIRARVCEETLAGGLIYVSGGDLKHRNGADVYYKFRPNSHFVYLTGVTEPGFACLVDPETQHFTLVAPKVPDDAAVWWGGLPSLDDMAEEAGADNCIYAQDLPQHIQKQYTDFQTLHVLDLDHPQQQQQLLDIPHFKQHQQQQLQHLEALQGLDCQFNSAFLQNTLDRCRMCKTAAEVGCLLEASRGSAAGHKAMWRASKPGLKEYQLEAAFVHAAAQAGLMHLGYPCIVGAGRNAAILHYERNKAVVGQQDLVLVDAGAEFRHYTADITRTFPASGVFTPQQRDIYNLVLSLQAHALSLIRPQVAWHEVQQSTQHLLLEQLQQLGIVRGSVEAAADAEIHKVFMPHGLGHFLGLDVHDVSDVGPVPVELCEGQVITVEPGVYFMPLMMEKAKNNKKQASCINMDAAEKLVGLGGVRIEDNVLITADGHFNITMAADMPKNAVEIEEYMTAHR